MSYKFDNPEKENETYQRKEGLGCLITIAAWEEDLLSLSRETKERSPGGGVPLSTDLRPNW